jgi:hypothetical protein
MTGALATLLLVFSGAAVMAVFVGYRLFAGQRREALQRAIETERRRLEAMSPTDPEYNTVRDLYHAKRAEAARWDAEKALTGSSDGVGDKGGDGGDGRDD